MELIAPAAAHSSAAAGCHMTFPNLPAAGSMYCEHWRHTGLL
jgi:hypothetical protein